MKKFKAVIATLLFIIAIVSICIFTWKAPLDYEGVPIIPSVVLALIIGAGFWAIVITFYRKMSDTKVQRQIDSEILDNLKMYALPKILDKWEVGSFEAKEISERSYVTFTFYVTHDLYYAMFIPKYMAEDYRRAVIKMGYVEFKGKDKKKEE